LGARDRIDAENVLRFKELIAQLDGRNVAYTMKRVGVERLPGAGFIEIEQIRLFPNDPLHRWKYRVCEQILPSIRLSNCKVRRSAILIRHRGETDPARRRHEWERELRLMHLDHADDPDDPIIQFNLARYYYHGLQQPEQALKFLSGRLERFHQTNWVGSNLYRLMVRCHRDLRQSEEALRVAAEGLAIYPSDTQLQSAKAMILLDRGDAVEAEEAFRCLLDASDGNRSLEEVRQCPIAGWTAKPAGTFGHGSPRRFRL
jgi:tetratricopeptide (TPR) repeat protein